MKRQLGKKLLCIVLALQMLLGLGVTGFAAEIQIPEGSEEVSWEPISPAEELKEEMPPESDVEQDLGETDMPIAEPAAEQAFGKIDKTGFVGTASSERDAANGNLPAANALDGDEKTIWHTRGDENGKGENPTCFPVHYVIDMTKATKVSELEIVGRTGAAQSINGFPVGFKVYASDTAPDEEDYKNLSGWEEVTDVRWNLSLSSGMRHKVVFPQTIEKRYLRLVIDNSLRPAGEDLASVAEFNLYYTDAMAALRTGIADAKTVLEGIQDQTAKEALAAAIATAETFLAAGDPTGVDAQVTALAEAVEAARASQTAEEKLASPDGRLEITVTVDALGVVKYGVTRDDNVLVQPSSLGYTLKAEDGGDMKSGFTLLGKDERSVDTSWTPGVNSTRDSIPDVYHETTFHLQGSAGRKLDIVFRAYDEGFGFYYAFPEDNAEILKDGFAIVQENSTFSIPHGTQAYYYGTHSQAVPGSAKVETLRQNHYAPMLFGYADGTYAGLFESNLYDYARLKLSTNGGVVSSDVRWGTDIVAEKAPFKSPWRGMIVGDHIGELQEKNYLVMNLSDEAIEGLYKLEDADWITTGKLIREAALTPENTKECIDFAVDNDIQFILYDSGWYGTEDGSKVDPRVPVIGEFLYMENNPGLGMRRCDVDVRDGTKWAAEQGVGVILYVNHIHLEKYDLDEVFSTYRDWGVTGVKFGFVNVGSQYWTKWLVEAVATAAKYGLVVKIHDEYIPTGLERAYPNLLNVEGVLGDEGNPSHSDDLKQVFTRTILGPSDHTFCYPMPQYRNPPKKTNAFSLASPILFYSGMSCPFWYGKPADHVGNPYPEIKFWKDMPGEWNESVHIDSSFGEYFTMARRNGDEWFLGSLSSVQRTLKLTPDFLKAGTDYVAEIYTDAPGATFAKNTVEISKFRVTSETEFTFPMIVGGGLAIRFAPATAADAEVPPYSAGRTMLQHTYSACCSIDLTKYTAKSVKESGFAARMAEAEALLANMAADEEAMLALVEALETAKESFVERVYLFAELPRGAMVPTASTERVGTHEAVFALDGDPTKIWHTLADVDRPHWFALDLGSVQTVSQLTIKARQGGNVNGTPTLFDIQVSSDGESYETVETVDWRGVNITSGSVHTHILKTPVTTQYIRLYIRDSAMNSGGAKPASMAEIYLYTAPYFALDQMISRGCDMLLRLEPGAEKDMLQALVDEARDFVETSSEYDETTMKTHMAALEEKLAAYGPSYQIATSASENGTLKITVPHEYAGSGYAYAGDSVLISATPEVGYELASVTVTGESGNSVAVSENRFTMPAEKVSVSAVFRAIYHGGGETPTITHLITATAGAGGKITPASTRVPSGGSRTFQMTADKDYVLTDLLLDGVSVSFETTANGWSYTLTNVRAAHSLKAVFTLESEITDPETPLAGLPFTDVTGHWAASAIDFAAKAGLMTGVSATSFNPEGTATRATVATILYRMAGSPAVEQGTSFTDVDAGAWYATAVTWCAGNDVIDGVSATAFAPDREITRQELATMLCRYAKHTGAATTATGERLSAFPDNADIAAWAREAMAWCTETGILTGKSGGLLAPQGTATRAELATMLERLATLLKK